MTRTEKVLANVFEDLIGYVDPLTDDLSPDSVPGWDSVTHVGIVEELEAQFGVRFQVDDIVEMTSIKGIKDALGRYGVVDDAG